MTDLNRLLAEDVMGWELNEKAKEYFSLHPAYGSSKEYQMMQGNWQPDTDIAQAFMLVEKMRSEGYRFDFWNESSVDELIEEIERGKFHGWYVAFEREKSWHAEADTPALAICKAIEQVIKDGEK